MAARPFPSPSRKGKKVGEAQTKAGTPTLNWLERRKMTRQMDLTRKKQARVETRAMLRTLWELEAESRGQKEAVRSKDIQLHLVLEKLVMRVRRMTGRQPRVFPAYFGTPGFPYNQGASAYLGDPQELSREDVDVTAGLAGSHSLGMLYVCVEDWVVRRSNRAMELVCPFEMLRGYVGMEFPGVVHPDDHIQLALLQQEQAHSFRPGDTLVLSVRMLRACMDGGTLVVAWRRQILEVAHVARDEEHGGKLHVMFTCVLEEGTVEPLTFDDSDRQLFQETSVGVSGVMTWDPQRTTESIHSLSNLMNDAGLEDQRNKDSPTVMGFISGVSSSMGGTLGIPQLLSFLANGAKSMMTSIMRTHVVLGLAPDGTPWLQKSAALCAFGFSSRYSTFVSTSLSGRLGGTLAPGVDSRQNFYGALKPQWEKSAKTSQESVTIGAVGLVFRRTWDSERQQHTRRLAIVTHNTFTYDAGERVAGERTSILFFKGGGALPRRVDVNCTRTGPPDPGLMDTFMSFSGEAGVENPFTELSKT